MKTMYLALILCLTSNLLFGKQTEGKKTRLPAETEKSSKSTADENVHAVVLDLDRVSLSLAQTQEMRRILLEIRAAKKDIWLYTEYYTLSRALIASACSNVTIMPEGNVRLNGLFAESLYFKNMLDKVGVAIDVVHIGKFKSAGESLYLDAPSEAAKQQSEALFDSLDQQILQQIADGYEMKTEALRNLINSGTTNAKTLLENKLVHHLDYRTDFINKVRKKYGEKAKFDRAYAFPNTGPPEIKSIFDFFKLMNAKKKGDEYEHPYIAVIPLTGAISDASIAPVRKAVLKATRDDMCKAIVLRINSPGGSALSSEVLWEATDEFKQTGRPIVVSMGSVAASGGYYTACSAQYIYAEEGTITGSIGVVGMKPVIGTALNNMGISVHSIKRGKFADIMNSSKKFTEEERAIIKNSMLDIYTVFKKRVVDCRGDKLTDEIENLAGGRVYTGSDALKVGLVDEIGGIDSAISKAATLAKLDAFDTHMLPKPRSQFDLFFQSQNKGGDEDPHEFIGVIKPQLTTTSLVDTIIEEKALRLLDNQKRRQIQLMLQQLRSIETQGVQLIAPSILTPELR